MKTIQQSQLNMGRVGFLFASTDRMGLHPFHRPTLSYFRKGENYENT